MFKCALTCRAIGLSDAHHVVKVDLAGHGPEFDADAADGGHLEGLRVEEVVGVGDLPRLPLALVVGVVDEGRVPLALVQRVVDHGLLPEAASGGRGALRVGHEPSLPLAVHLLVPVGGLVGLGVSDLDGLVFEPT